MPPTPRTVGSEPILHLDQVILFDTFSLLGIVFNALLFVCCLLSRKLARPRVWFGVIGASLAYSISNALLLGHQKDTQPPFELCLFQAMTVYATPPTFGVAFTCFSIYIYFETYGILQDKYRPLTPRQANALVIAPWIVFLGICTEILLVGTRNRAAAPVDVVPYHFYCTLSRSFTAPIAINCVILLSCIIVVVAVQVWTMTFLYRNRRSYKDADVVLSRSLPPLSDAVRLFILTLLECGVAILTIYSVTRMLPSPSSAGWSVACSASPLVTAIIFGSSKDIRELRLFTRITS